MWISTYRCTLLFHFNLHGPCASLFYKKYLLWLNIFLRKKQSFCHFVHQQPTQLSGTCHQWLPAYCQPMPLLLSLNLRSCWLLWLGTLLDIQGYCESSPSARLFQMPRPHFIDPPTHLGIGAQSLELAAVYACHSTYQFDMPWHAVT